MPRATQPSSSVPRHNRYDGEYNGVFTPGEPPSADEDDDVHRTVRWRL